MALPIDVNNPAEKPGPFTHRQAQEATDLLRQENRDSVLKIGPRSSVGHALKRKISQNVGVLGQGGHGVDTGGAATGVDRQPSDKNVADADEDLRVILEAWPAIPPAMQVGILAMIRAALQR
jgi:hypothetical protein